MEKKGNKGNPKIELNLYRWAFSAGYLRGTNLIFIYASTYIIYEVKNFSGGCTRAESPVPRDTLPDSRSGQGKLP